MVTATGRIRTVKVGDRWAAHTGTLSHKGSNTMAAEHQQNGQRSEFIKEMYRIYWANMARSMDGVWKTLAPITVAGTIIAAVDQQYLPMWIGTSFSMVIVLWALNVSIDMNAWHRRNLFLACKAEAEFLRTEDYGHLLPAAYKTPPTKWITFYKVNAYVFVALLLLTMLYVVFFGVDHSGYAIETWIPMVVLASGGIATIVNAVAQERSAKTRHQELFASGD